MTREQPEPTPRIFSAIPLPPEVRDHVSRIVDVLSGSLEGVRWVPEANLHVTLRFIGNCPVSKVDELIRWMHKAARHLPASLEVGGVGGFPSQGSARVIWVGAADATGAASKVYNVIDKGAQRCGFGREGRAYRPHITVGRAKRPVKIPAELKEGLAGDVMAFEASEIVLYESRLDSAGATYSELARAGAPGSP